MPGYRPSANPYVIPRAMIRLFGGIGGEDRRVFKYLDAKGNDISNSYFNVLEDVDISETGTMKLRDGCRKISSSGIGDDIVDLVYMTVGGRDRYGVQIGESFSIVDIPDANKDSILGFLESREMLYISSADPIDLLPSTITATLSNEYPISDPGAFEL